MRAGGEKTQVAKMKAGAVGGSVKVQGGLRQELATGLFTPLDGVQGHTLDSRVTQDELVGVGEEVGDSPKDSGGDNVLRKHVW